MKVIIVDEHPMVQEALNLMMRVLQFVLVIGNVASYAEAYVMCRALQPDVVLIDIASPGAGGYDIIRMLRALNPAMKIIVMTGIGWNSEQQQHARTLGADYFVHKLASPQAMEYVFNEILDDDKTIYRPQES